MASGTGLILDSRHAARNPSTDSSRLRHHAEIKESSFNVTMFKIVQWIGFFIAVFGVFLFLGSYCGGSSMGAMTITFETIGKTAVKWAVIAGTDAISFSCIFMTVGGTGFVIGIMGRISYSCRQSKSPSLSESSQASSDDEPEIVPRHQMPPYTYQLHAPAFGTPDPNHRELSTQVHYSARYGSPTTYQPPLPPPHAPTTFVPSH